MFVDGTKRGHFGFLVERKPGGQRRGIGDFVFVGGFEGLEELLVALDVLAAVGLHAGVDGALRALMGQRLGETGECRILDVLHRGERRGRGGSARGRGEPCLSQLSRPFPFSAARLVPASILGARCPLPARACVPHVQRQSISIIQTLER